MTGALCLVLGVGIGYLMAPGDATREADSGANHRAQDRPQSRSLDSRQRASQHADEVPSSTLPLDGGDELVTVPASLIRGITNTPPVESCRDSLFRQDDPVEKSLAITAHERERMIEAWDTVRKKVEDLEVRSSRSEVHEDGSVSIVVPDLSQSLGPVGEAFGAEIEVLLGPERGRLFLAMKRLDKVFTPQAGERRHHISVEAVGDGNWRYHMTCEDDNNRHVWVGDGIPNEIRHITDAARIQPSLTEALKQP